MGFISRYNGKFSVAFPTLLPSALGLILNFMATGCALGTNQNNNFGQEGEFGPVGQFFPESSLARMYFVTDSTLHRQAGELFRAKCISCHNSEAGFGGFDTIGNLDQMILDQLIRPANGNNSRFVAASIGPASLMPPGSGLNAAETQLLSDWVNLGIGRGPNTPLDPPIVPFTPTFNSIFLNILQDKCLGCHRMGQARGGVRYDNYNATLNTGSVVPGNANASEFFTEVESGSMPTAGNLNAAEITIIRDWINNGAPDN